MRTKRSAAQLDGEPYRLMIEGDSRVRVVWGALANPDVLAACGVAMAVESSVVALAVHFLSFLTQYARSSDQVMTSMERTLPIRNSYLWIGIRESRGA